MRNAKLIIGLGNPGPKYQDTRHNIGFRVLNNLARRLGSDIKHRKCLARVGEGELGEHKLFLAKPKTFMNRSGTSVARLIKHLHLKPTEIIVIHDDLDIEFGRIQIKSRGGAGGHKGILSIIEELGTSAFVRLRIGIGRPSKDTVDYVLEPFSSAEKKVLDEIIERAILALDCIIKKGTSAAMNQYNRKPQINAER